MRRMCVALVVVVLAGCGGKKKPAKVEENPNPYHDVMPEKMKQKVEAAQQKEDDRNQRKLDEAQQAQ